MVYLNRVLRCTPTYFHAQRPIAAKWRNINGFERKENPPGWNPEGPRGADGNRNHDLFDANEALYQLSYSPVDVVLLRRTTSATIVRPLPKCKFRGAAFRTLIHLRLTPSPTTPEFRGFREYVTVTMCQSPRAGTGTIKERNEKGRHPGMGCRPGSVRPGRLTDQEIRPWRPSCGRGTA